MKILISKTLFYWVAKTPKNNKSWELEGYWNFRPSLEFQLYVKSYDIHIFAFTLDIFGLFSLSIHWSKKCDHAGFTFAANILGLDMSYMYHDIRHWNYEEDRWETDEEIEQAVLAYREEQKLKNKQI